MYRLYRGVHLQYNYKCRDLYNLCCRLYRRDNLPVHSLYCNNEQGVFSVYRVCRWHMEKCYLYCPGKYRMYCLRSGVHIQYHNECCDLYSLYVLRCWHLCVHSLLYNCKQGLYILCGWFHIQYNH